MCWKQGRKKLRRKYTVEREGYGKKKNLEGKYGGERKKLERKYDEEICWKKRRLGGRKKLERKFGRGRER